mmetsp:Transcript_36066/g.81170  ORF Transcript_36066/g.81170 Transcript_36066/m.81170 type:complete len:101 (-) Transcript_36066:46-348(-)
MQRHPSWVEAEQSRREAEQSRKRAWDAQERKLIWQKGVAAAKEYSRLTDLIHNPSVPEEVKDLYRSMLQECKDHMINHTQRLRNKAAKATSENSESAHNP